MAINAKVVMIFGASKWGWTETYYYSSSTGNLSTAEAAAVALAKIRTKLLGSTTQLEGIRISDLAVKGSTILNTEFTWSNQLTDPILGAQGSPWSTALFTLRATDSAGIVYRRAIMLRGLPAIWEKYEISNPLNPNLDAQFRTLANAFLRALKGGNPNSLGSPWCIRGSDRNRASNPTFPLSSIVTTVDPGGYWKVIIPTAPIGWTPGTRIHITGATGPGSAGLNGDAYITDQPAPSTFTLSTRQRCPTNLVTLTGKAVAYLRDYKFFPISYAFFDRFVKRDTGRAFFGTAGHQSTPRC